MNTLLYPPSIDWELTSICNHNCVHCYNFWRGTGIVDKSLPSEDYYVSVANRIVDSNPVSVQITGGEPLLVWKQFKKAFQILIDSGINVSINTNATLVTEEIAEFLGRNSIDAFVSYPCLKKDIFDSIVHCKGAFERAESGINTLLKYGVRVSLNMVVTKINLPYVYETGVYLKNKFSINYFSATKASFPQNATLEFKEKILNLDEFNFMLKELIKVKNEMGIKVDSAWVYSMCGFENQEILEQFGFHRKCGCGRYNFVIDSSGNMKACGCDSRTYGNILDDSFENAISRMNVWHTGEQLPEKCVTCKNLKYCGGGCRLDAVSMIQSYCGLDSTASSKGNGIEVENKKKSVDLDENQAMRLNPNIEIVKERCGIRLSVGTNYAFVTDDFYQYAKVKKCFTFGMILRDARKGDNVLSIDINTLLRKKILVNVDSAEYCDYEEFEAFHIIAQPYIEDTSSSVVKDYICDLNVRYSRKK